MQVQAASVRSLSLPPVRGPGLQNARNMGFGGVGFRGLGFRVLGWGRLEIDDFDCLQIQKKSLRSIGIVA